MLTLKADAERLRAEYAGRPRELEAIEAQIKQRQANTRAQFE
jgi:hypothetical protein